MTAKEAIDIISESSLWGMLTLKEKAEAVVHAMEISRQGFSMPYDDFEKICDFIRD